MDSKAWNSKAYFRQKYIKTLTCTNIIFVFFGLLLIAHFW